MNKNKNIWEKVAEVSEAIGYIEPSLSKAKVDIAKQMSKAGLMFFETSQDISFVEGAFITKSNYRLVNTSDGEHLDTVGVAMDIDVVKAKELSYTHSLLNLFNVSIDPSEQYEEELKEERELLESNFSKTIEKNNRSFIPNYSLSGDILTEKDNYRDIQTEKPFKAMLLDELKDLKKNKGNVIVNPKRLIAIYGKVKALNWNKKEFKETILELMDIEDDTRISEMEYDFLIDYLEKKIKAS